MEGLKIDAFQGSSILRKSLHNGMGYIDDAHLGFGYLHDCQGLYDRLRIKRITPFLILTDYSHKNGNFNWQRLEITHRDLWSGRGVAIQWRRLGWRRRVQKFGNIFFNSVQRRTKV